MDDGRIGKEKGNRKGKLNGPEMLDGLTKLVTVVLNVVHE